MEENKCHKSEKLDAICSPFADMGENSEEIFEFIIVKLPFC